MNPEKLARMAASVRTGGKGSVRRKRKAVHRPAGIDDKRLQQQFKRLGLQPVTGIEEANLFKEDYVTVIHFENPKLQAHSTSNMYVLTGRSEVKPLQDLLPGIIAQLGPEHVQALQGMMQGEEGGDEPSDSDEDDDDDDDDVPDLVETFDAPKPSE